MNPRRVIGATCLVLAVGVGLVVFIAQRRSASTAKQAYSQRIQDALEQYDSFQRGMAAIQMELWDAAGRNLSEALQSNPRHPLLLYYLGAVHAQQENVIPGAVFLAAYLESRTQPLSQVPRSDDEVKQAIRDLETVAEKRVNDLFTQAIDIAQALPEGEGRDKAFQAIVAQLIYGRRLEWAGKIARAHPRGTLPIIVQMALKDHELNVGVGVSDYGVEILNLAEAIAMVDVQESIYWVSGRGFRTLNDLPADPREREALLKLEEEQRESDHESLSMRMKEPCRLSGQAMNLIVLGYILARCTDRSQWGEACFQQGQELYAKAKDLYAQAKGSTEWYSVGWPTPASPLDKVFREKVMKDVLYMWQAEGPEDEDENPRGVRLVAFGEMPYQWRQRWVGEPGGLENRWLSESDWAVYMAENEGVEPDDLFQFTIKDPAFYDSNSVVLEILAKNRYEVPGGLAELAGKYSLALYILEEHQKLTDFKPGRGSP